MTAWDPARGRAPRVTHDYIRIMSRLSTSIPVSISSGLIPPFSTCLLDSGPFFFF